MWLIELNSTSDEFNLQHRDYGLNSRNLRRYIIEDVMFIKSEEDVLVLISDDSPDFYYFNRLNLNRIMDYCTLLLDLKNIWITIWNLDKKLYGIFNKGSRPRGNMWYNLKNIMIYRNTYIYIYKYTLKQKVYIHITRIKG